MQHLGDCYGRGLPLAEWIIRIENSDQRVGLFHSLQVRFELTAHGFLVGHVYDLRAGSQGIEIAVPQLRRPLGRLLLVWDIADCFERII